MAKLVLAYNFSAERLPALKLACMLVKSPLKVVPREQLLQPLGYLAGVPGVEPVDEETENYLALEDEALLNAVYAIFRERYKDVLTFED